MGARYSATAATIAPIQIVHADDAPDWRRRFYDPQIKAFEEALEEVETAEDPQDAAPEAVAAFEPIRDNGPSESLQAISEALRGLTMRALRRKELQREIAEIRTELERVAAYRRKRRNNEAALLLLM